MYVYLLNHKACKRIYIKFPTITTRENSSINSNHPQKNPWHPNYLETNKKKKNNPPLNTGASEFLAILNILSLKTKRYHSKKFLDRSKSFTILDNYLEKKKRKKKEQLSTQHRW